MANHAAPTSGLISYQYSWHGMPQMRAVDLRGRKSAVHAAAEAEIEAVAAHAGRVVGVSSYWKNSFVDERSLAELCQNRLPWK